MTADIIHFPTLLAREPEPAPPISVRADWQNMPPVVAAEIATFIICCWMNGQPVTRRDVEIVAESRDSINCGWVPPVLAVAHFDEGLNVAKFIAHTTGLKIPKAGAPIFTEEAIRELRK